MALLPLHSSWPEAGCDEAGRGCLAGPVFGAAVILPKDYHHTGLNDSKQLSKKQRQSLRSEIEKEAISWSVGMVQPEIIDRINILQASIYAMQVALGKLNHPIVHIIVDGNRFKPFQDIPHTCVVKGDGKYLSIAAASILAKTHRDEYMTALHEQDPRYAWNQNMGYPTKAHRDAIRVQGPSIFHRKSFRLLEEQETWTLFS